MSKYKILIATYPFGKSGRKPLDLLEASGWEIIHNPFHRRLKDGDIPKIIKDVDAIIAGTEPYSIEALKNSNVKLISRVGIGLDSIPLKACQENGIQVTYTPDAPSQAVAELTLANIINLTRYILPSDRSVRLGAWNRMMGFLVKELTIGIVGVGRIGKKVIKLLQPFQPNIIACDLEPDLKFGKENNIKWVDKEEIFKTSDLVSLHIPSNKQNFHYLNRESLSKLKTGSYIINTARGPVVDEVALYDALVQGHLAGAALDVFKNEPYEGPLAQLDNVILTAHIAASAKECRFLMELGAAEDCIRVLKGEKPENNALTEENLNNQ